MTPIKQQVRFYCGNNKEDDLERYKSVLDNKYSAYTVYEAKGRYKGSEESSLVFEIFVTEGENLDTVAVDIAQSLAKAGEQECVLVVTAEVRAYMVGQDGREVV